MTNAEQEKLLRGALEVIIHDTVDAETIRRRALFYGQVLDCPSAKKIPMSELAKIFGVSRQAVYQQVDSFAAKMAEIKANFSNSKTTA